MNDQTLNAPATDGDAIEEEFEEQPVEQQLAGETTNSRRSAIRTLGKLGLGAAFLTAGNFLNPRVASAQSNDDAPTAAEILNFALTLEYLERSFYQQGTDSGVIPGSAMPIFELIQEHEEKHVDFLTSQIEMNTDADPVEFSDSDFDFTAGGNFDPFNNYATFLTLAQGFEDTGVRAYKGQAANVLGTPYLNAALQIHALEARHAAEVRRLRDGMNGVEVEPWIEGEGAPDDSPIAAVYNAGMAPDYAPDRTYPAEGNTMQAGVDLTMLGDYSDFTDNVEEQAAAAFDEPLDMETVLDIAGPFIGGGMAESVMLDFSNVFGVLNYAYALEQLEAAFYTQAVNNPFGGATDEEMNILTDLRDHEIVHREFFANKIPSLEGELIPDLTPNFEDVDFSDRQSVLQTAQTFEDLGVKAYNGAAHLIEMENPIMAAGEIVSVEARHAAAIRDLLDPLSFAPNAFDEGLDPSAVLENAAPFIENEINTSGL